MGKERRQAVCSLTYLTTQQHDSNWLANAHTRAAFDLDGHYIELSLLWEFEKTLRNAIATTDKENTFEQWTQTNPEKGIYWHDVTETHTPAWTQAQNHATDRNPQKQKLQKRRENAEETRRNWVSIVCESLLESQCRGLACGAIGKWGQKRIASH